MAKIRYKIFEEVKEYADGIGIWRKEVVYGCVVKRGWFGLWRGITMDDYGEYTESFSDYDLAEFKTPSEALDKTIDILFRKEEEQPTNKVRLFKKGKIKI